MERGKRIFQRGGPVVLSLALLAVLALLFLWRVSLRGDVLLSADRLLAYEPWRSEIPGAEAVNFWNEKTFDPIRSVYVLGLFIRNSWRAGQIPFWQPEIGLGLPILAWGIAQVLYPVNNVLWQVMDVSAAFGWSAILHLFLAGMFTYLYLRELGIGHFGRLVAAIAFSYSSVLVTWLGLRFFMDSMVWLPLIFWGLERALNRRNWRWILLGVGGLLLQILAGSVQLVMYGLTALALYAAARAGQGWWQQRNLSQLLRPLWYAALIVIFGVGLAALQILPTAELISSGIVRSRLGFDTTLPWRAALRILIPDVNGTPVDGHNMSSLEFEAYFYIGLLPLFFAAASLFAGRAAGAARILFGIGLLFLLVIFNVSPFYQLFATLYPTFSALGFHRSLYAVAFLWAAAAGIGADGLLRQRPIRTLNWLVGAGVAAGGVVLAVALWLAWAAKYQARFFWPVPPLPDVQPNLPYLFSNLLIFLTLLAVVLGLLWLWSRQKIKPAMFAGLSLALLVIDLFLTHLDYNPAVPQFMVDVTPPSLSAMQQAVRDESAPARLSGSGRMLPPNTAGIFRLPAIQMHDNYLSQRLDAYANLTGLRRGGKSFRELVFEPATNPLFNALNVRYLYARRDDLPSGDWFSVLNQMGEPNALSDHPGAGQVRYWNIQNWTQPVLFAPAGTTLSYQGVLPYPATFETAVAVDPQADATAPVTFELFAFAPGQEPGEPLFSVKLDPAGNDAGTGWVPVSVDLSEFAGRPVVIALHTRADSDAVPAGWADPLLTDASKYEQVYYGVNSIYRNKQALPRAWVVHRVTEVSSMPAAEEILAQPGFDPAAEAVVEGLLSQPAQPAAGEDSAQITAYSGNRVTIAANLSSSGLLVLADMFYPGWQVIVDGIPQPVLAANLAMRGVVVPAGQHTVEFRYEPLSFRVGVVVSAVTLLALAVVVVVFGRRTKKQTLVEREVQ